MHAALEGTYTDRQQKNTLVHFSDNSAYIRALLAQYIVLAKSTQAAIERAEDAGDPETTDLLMHLQRTLEKSIRALAAQL